MENSSNLINAIVKYSKDCIVKRFAKNHLQKSMFIAKRLPYIPPSIDTIKVIIDEIDSRLIEIENNIKKLITPLFEGKDFSYGDDGKYSLSTNEIVDGYILLKEVARREPKTKQVISYHPDDYIILLRNFKDEENGFIFLPATLYKIGREFKEESISKIPKQKNTLIDNDLLGVIINKRNAYGYL